ncbi:MAG: nitrous oxide reductase family maturation protein NosD [Bacteroidetes bacterium]|nr:nitrous oxide reductase family maturation protein NosD [Bacteroidota bacterium]
MRRAEVICLVLFVFVCMNANARSSKVFANNPGSLQQAIDRSIPGDTLLVQKGTYKEHDIQINKRLVLIGNNWPVIDGQNKYQLLTIEHDSVTIIGLQLQNTGRSSLTDIAAIKLLNANHVTVRNNKLYNNTYGVYLQNANNNIVDGNIIQSNSVDELNSGNGVHAWKSAYLTISNNIISGHRDGIYFEFVTDSHITNNRSFKNVRYGLHFMFSHRDTYRKNVFMDNGAGVAVMFSKFVEMYDNTFVHNWGDAAYAILLKEISDSKIIHNRFIKNTVGIYFEGTSRIQVLNNEFKENGWAMRVQASCSDNNFERNNFESNSFDVATNGTMMLNTFKQNYWDKYDGYDLDKNRIGDVPYYPVSMYSVVTEKIPAAMILYRSFITDIMDQVEKILPSVTPDQLKDDAPMMKSWNLQ